MSDFVTRVLWFYVWAMVAISVASLTGALFTNNLAISIILYFVGLIAAAFALIMRRLTIRASKD